MTLNCDIELLPAYCHEFAHPLTELDISPTFYDIVPGVKAIGGGLFVKLTLTYYPNVKSVSIICTQ